MTVEFIESPEKKERGSWFDRLLERHLPGWAGRREVWRLKADEARFRRKLAGALEDELDRPPPEDDGPRELGAKGKGTGIFAGAKKDRGRSTWNPGTMSADAATNPDLEDLRDRTRDLLANDGSASGLKNMWVEQIVGEGLRPQSRPNWKRIPGMTESGARDFAEDAEWVYRRWAKAVDVTGLLDDCSMQHLVMHQVFSCGESFVLHRSVERGPSRPYSLALEAIEPDRVETPIGESANPLYSAGIKRRRVSGDKNTGGYYVPESYSIRTYHPGDMTVASLAPDWKEVPRYRKDGIHPLVSHLYRMERPEQSRGFPLIAPALDYFKDAKDYFQAETWAAKVAACWTLFITTPDPMGAAVRATASVREDGTRTELMRPGLVRWLSTGQKPEEFAPQRPTSQFESYVYAMQRMKGLALNMPYEQALLDFSKTNYSSGRMALTEVRRIYRRWQQWLVATFLNHVWVRLLEEAVLRGEIRAPNFMAYREEYARASWVGSGWSWVDPSKEVRADVDAYNANMTTLADLYAARGEDWEEKLEQRAREKKRMEELGLTAAEAAPSGAPPPGGPGGEEPEEEEPEDETEEEPEDDQGEEDESREAA